MVGNVVNVDSSQPWSYSKEFTSVRDPEIKTEYGPPLSCLYKRSGKMMDGRKHMLCFLALQSMDIFCFWKSYQKLNLIFILPNYLCT